MLLDNLTVEELLMYTIEIRNPWQKSLASKQAKVAWSWNTVQLGVIIPQPPIREAHRVQTSTVQSAHAGI